MQNIIEIIGLAGSVIGWICWLINKKDERNFCQKEGKDANDNYIELHKAKKK